MPRTSKQELKDKGLMEVRLIIKPEVEKLVRLFAEKLSNGTIKPMDTIRVE